MMDDCVEWTKNKMQESIKELHGKYCHEATTKVKRYEDVFSYLSTHNQITKDE